MTKEGPYARFGVREFWLLDFEKKSVEVLTLEAKTYKLVGIFFDVDEIPTPYLRHLKLKCASLPFM